jgi:hypothetical protein
MSSGSSERVMARSEPAYAVLLTPSNVPMSEVEKIDIWYTDTNVDGPVSLNNGLIAVRDDNVENRRFTEVFPRAAELAQDGKVMIHIPDHADALVNPRQLDVILGCSTWTGATAEEWDGSIRDYVRTGKYPQTVRLFVGAGTKRRRVDCRSSKRACVSAEVDEQEARSNGE